MKTDTTTLFFALSSFKMEKWTCFGYWAGVHSRLSISFLACPQTRVTKYGFKHYRTACPQSCKTHMVQALEHDPFVYNAQMITKIHIHCTEPSQISTWQRERRIHTTKYHLCWNLWSQESMQHMSPSNKFPSWTNWLERRQMVRISITLWCHSYFSNDPTLRILAPNFMTSQGLLDNRQIAALTSAELAGWRFLPNLFSKTPWAWM